MNNLSIKYCGVDFTNPFILPSGIIQEIKDKPLLPDCPVNIDILSAIENSFEGIIKVENDSNNKTYQLQRLFDMKELISNFVIFRDCLPFLSRNFFTYHIITNFHIFCVITII